MNTIGITSSNKTEIINAINDYSDFSVNQKKNIFSFSQRSS